jgi:hypothetical protein
LRSYYQIFLINIINSFINRENVRVPVYSCDESKKKNATQLSKNFHFHFWNFQDFGVVSIINLSAGFLLGFFSQYLNPEIQPQDEQN